ncbi:MAG: radical SAM protein [Stackebrandtia sp.]
MLVETQSAVNPLSKHIRADLPGRFNELDVLRREWQRVIGMLNGEVLPPYEVLIHPSSGCNLRCAWCIGDHVPIEIWDDSQSEPTMLDAAKTAHETLENVLADPEAMLSVLRGIVDYRKTDSSGTEFTVEAVSFSGLIGEPLMSKVAVTEALHFLADNGRRAGLFTNGVLMDAAVREALVRSAYVHLSLDAGSEDSYALLKFQGRSSGRRKFSSALENLSQLAVLRANAPDSQLALNSSFILYPENYHEVYEAARLLKDSGVDTMRLKRDISGERLLDDNQAQHVQDLVAKIKSDLVDEDFHLVEIHQMGLPPDLTRHFSACRITRLMAAIGSDGHLYPCNYHPRPGGAQYGSAVGEQFAAVWEGQTRASLMTQLPQICPSVCDPFKNRANTLLETAEDVARQESAEQLYEYVNELVEAKAYGSDRDSFSALVPVPDDAAAAGSGTFLGTPTLRGPSTPDEGGSSCGGS